ncbi:response regulator transcription factor [Lichenihabitans psoromatis]|uniref:response regulator transcription factor n=1 Tax=Lichenihabitans psoromatis TaxID=2528642 RepID=UPI001035A332|nr:response regulator transcription factor [Lichenihabitans psoromatis]
MVDPQPSRAAGTRDIVLLVDDTPDTLAMLTDALEQSGFMVLIATGGSAALSICERVTPDVILMDAMMPGLDGFETCRRLKATAAVAHVPVIFMTALSETEHIVQGLGAGGVDYVTKPVVLDEMFARIRTHLHNARAAQSTRLALDTAGSFLLAIDQSGTLLWATPQARRLLQRAAPLSNPGALAPEIVASIHAAAAGGGPQTLTWPTSQAGVGHLQFGFLGTIGAGEYLVRLTSLDGRNDEDALRRRFSLTAREAEVLLWIARGKSNRDIADILALSPRTVNKHLEGIYTKLGVENRASAAVLANRVWSGN